MSTVKQNNGGGGFSTKATPLPGISKPLPLLPVLKPRQLLPVYVLPFLPFTDALCTDGCNQQGGAVLTGRTCGLHQSSKFSNRKLQSDSRCP